MDAISRSRAAVLRFLFARGSEDREGFPEAFPLPAEGPGMRRFLHPDEILTELRQHLPPAGSAEPHDGVVVVEMPESGSLARLVRPAGPVYRPGSGEAGESLRWIAKTLAHEIETRLDRPCPGLTREALRRAAILAGTDLSDWSREDLRAAFERIFRDLGFPALSARFTAHNERVDALCGRWLTGWLVRRGEPTMMEWLLLETATNRFEIWPATRLRPILESVTRDLRRPLFAAAFAPLAERLEERLRAGAPLALFTDNHGEIAADVAFLACLQRQYETRVLLDPEAVSGGERRGCVGRWESAPVSLGSRPAAGTGAERLTDQGNPPHRFKPPARDGPDRSPGTPRAHHRQRRSQFRNAGGNAGRDALSPRRQNGPRGAPAGG